MAKKEKKVEQEFTMSLLNQPMRNYQVYVMSKMENLLVSIAAFLVGGFVGEIFYMNLFMIDGYPTLMTHISNVVVFVVVGLLAIKFLKPMYKQRCLEKRRSELKHQFRDMLESLSASFSVGSNAQTAFEDVVNDLKTQYTEKDFIVIEMQEVLNGMKQNINPEVMLADFGARSGNEDIRSFADIFEICYPKGGSMSEIISRTHSVISDKMAIADEIDTKLTSNKMQHNVMSIMPIVVVAMLRFTNDAFAANFATPIGVLANTVAIAVFVGAYIYGNKIVDIKE